MKYVYKIVAALGAISVLPLLVFLETIYFKMSSTALNAIFQIGQMLGNETLSQAIKDNNGAVPQAIADTYSLYELYDLFSNFGDLGEEGKIIESIDILITPLIVAGVVLILLALCAIVTAVLAFVVKNNRKVIYSSIAGIGLSFMLKECFECLAAPILDGTISLATIMDSTWAGLIGQFEEFLLNTNFWFIPAVFGAIILWTVLYNYTLPEKEKKERKLMLGEADEE